MTEPARPSRWGGPLLIAPCAAAMFGAAVWWAGDTTPMTATSTHATSTPATSTPAPAPTDESLHRELARTLEAQHKQAAALRRRLEHLTADLARVHAGRGQVSTGGGTNQGGGLGAPIAVPPAPVVAPPAAPPPVQATTGASG